jgi:hypothetical protein
MLKQSTISRGFRNNKAFTLVELLLASTITVMVVAAAGTILIFGTKIYYTDANQLSTNYDMHKLMLAMETDAAFANEFYIYDVDTNGIPAVSVQGVDNKVSTGQSGDLLLLMTTQTNPATAVVTITNIVAYCRGNPAGNNGAGGGPLHIYRYATGTISAAGTLLPAQLYANYIQGNFNLNQPFLPTATVVGTATDNPPPKAPEALQAHTNLFYNLGGGAVGTTGAFMLLSQIYEQQNGATVLSIDTYNLTMWPRS